MNDPHIVAMIDTLDAEPPQGGDHSPAPWTIRDNIGDVLIAVDANGNDTQIMADLQHDPEVGINGDPEGAAADMRRIVACVNACEGLPTEVLEAGTVVEIAGRMADRVACAPHWTPVDAELPDDDISVLVAFDDGEVWTACRDGGHWYYQSGDMVMGTVTHWMHFPTPPGAA